MAGARFFVWLILAALPLIGAPNALAGTEQNPEVQDAGDDYEPRLPTHRHGDILSAWLHNVTGDGASITLKVGTLASDSRAVYDVTWLQQDSFSIARRSDEAGVRATADRGMFRWRTLERSDSASELRENIPLDGRVTYGSPGYLTWNLPRTATNWSHQFQLTAFVARSWNLDALRATPSGEIDRSAPSAATLTIKDFPLWLNVSTIEVPPRPAELLDTPGDADQGPSDIGAVWLSSNSRPSILVEVSSLDYATPNCLWDGHFSATDPDSLRRFAGSWLINLTSSGWRFVSGSAEWGPESVPADLEVDVGKPGRFRFSSDAVEAPNFFSLRDSNFRLDMYCRNDPANSHDTIGRALAPAPVPGPPCVAMMLASAIMFFRRQNR